MPTIKNKHPKMRRNEVCPCEINAELPKEERKSYKRCCLKEIQDQEQQAYMLIHHNERIEKVKKNVAASIQHDIDHPIILPDSKVIAPLVEGGIIIP